jgi:hypothetical protein
MHNPSSVHISLSAASPHLLPDGSCVVQRSPQEIEVWGANISEHYTIRVEATDSEKMDVIYLGSDLPTLKH